MPGVVMSGGVMTVVDMPASGSWKERGGWVVRALMRDFALTSEQAAGIVGNLGYESAGFTVLQEMAPAAGGRGGYGWAQWTGPRGPFEAWCAVRGIPPSSDEANYGFLCEELRGTHRTTIEALRKCVSVEAAVWSVGQTYERPGGTTATNLPGYGGRCDYAYSALGAASAPPAPEDNGPEANPSDLQRHLVDLGYPIAVDGIAGRRTCGAALDALKKAPTIAGNDAARLNVLLAEVAEIIGRLADG